MPKFAANLTMLFTEQPFLDRFAAAAQAGFEAVEFLFPYPYAIDDLRSRLDTHHLRLVLHNLPAGDWEGGERGLACLPGREREFRDGVHKAIDYAKGLGVVQLNCLVGRTPKDSAPDRVRRTLIDNLRYAGGLLHEHGITLLIEPVNTFDVPGFHVARTRQALELIEEVGQPNLRLLYDVYHAQRMEGELGATISRHLAQIGHIQIADNPGRGEPGSGEINYCWLFQHIDRRGYAGWIGCEYKPALETDAGLGWRQSIAGLQAQTVRASQE